MSDIEMIKITYIIKWVEFNIKADILSHFTPAK